MKKTNKKTRFLFSVIAIILSISFLMMGCSENEPVEPNESSNESSQLSDEEKKDPIPTVDKQLELSAAKEKNDDTVAWLYIPAAEIDDQIMQAENNAYYLHFDENENYSVWGCYYADCRSVFGSRENLNTNTVIYGHSADDCDPNGEKFTKLFRFMDAKFTEENPYIYLSIDGEELIFQIAACVITDTSFDYITPNPVGDGITPFIESIERKNWLNINGLELSEDDKLLTLSTCCKKFDANNTGEQRLVIIAKLLPEGALKDDYTVTAALSPEMP